MTGGVGGPETSHLEDQSGTQIPQGSSSFLQGPPSLGLGNHGLGERDGATRADFCLSLLETNGKMVGSNYRRLRGDPSPGLAPGPKGMAEPGQEPYQDDFGEHSCP